MPVPPYPAWAQADAALASVATLLRRLHDAARSFDPAGSTWSTEMADPAGGPIVCHNDVCLENVVFRDGVAVGLLDFDFAAPGPPGLRPGPDGPHVRPGRRRRQRRAPRMGTRRPSRPAPRSSPTPTASTPRGGPSCSTSSPAPSAGAASSCAAGWRPAIRTSSRCGTRWAAWSASTAGAAGGPPSATASPTRCAEGRDRNSRRPVDRGVGRSS